MVSCKQICQDDDDDNHDDDEDNDDKDNDDDDDYDDVLTATFRVVSWRKICQADALMMMMMIMIPMTRMLLSLHS